MKTFNTSLLNNENFKPVDQKKTEETVNMDKVWSTKKYEEAKEAIKRNQRYYLGSPYKDGIIGVKKENLSFNLTKDEIKELRKAKDDIIYFAENFCQIKREDGTYGKFKLRPYQVKALKTMQDNRYTIMLMSRQVGKSVMSAIFVLHYVIFNPKKNILVTAMKADTAQEILKKMKDIYKTLPFYMKPGVVVWNVKDVEFDNGCVLMTSATTENTGVGYTYDFVFADEFARVDNNISEQFWRAVAPTLSSLNNSKCVITSTANGMNLFYRLYMGAVNKTEGNQFAYVLTKWDDVPGHDEEWKKRELALIGGNEELFNQEYNCQFLSGDTMLLDTDTLKKLESSSTEYIHHTFYELDETELDYKGLKWNPDTFDAIFDDLSNKRFVFSIDLAQGTKRDYSVINIFEIQKLSNEEIENVKNPKTEFDFLKLVQVALYRNNEQSVSDIAKITMAVIKILGIDNCVINFEVNHGGDYFYKTLEDNDDFYPDMVVHTQHNMMTPTLKAGLRITNVNKVNFCQDTKKLINRDFVVINESNTINELSMFGLNKRGSYSAASGHDDLAMTVVNLIPVFTSDNYYTVAGDVLSQYPIETYHRINNILRNSDTSEVIDYNSLGYDTIGDLNPFSKEQNQLEIMKKYYG